MSYTVTEPPKRRRFSYGCCNCGSTDIEQKCWCRWDKDAQEWVFVEDDGCDEFYCNSCMKVVSDLSCDELEKTDDE